MEEKEEEMVGSQIKFVTQVSSCVPTGMDVLLSQLGIPTHANMVHYYHAVWHTSAYP